MGDAEMRDEASEPEVKPIAPGTFGFGFPGNVSRRALLAGGGAAALTALLAACGDDDDSVTATTAGGGATTAAPETTAASTTTEGSETTKAGSTATTTSGGTETTKRGRQSPEATVEEITLGLQSLQEQYVDPHFAVGGLIFPLRGRSPTTCTSSTRTPSTCRAWRPATRSAPTS